MKLTKYFDVWNSAKNNYKRKFKKQVGINEICSSQLSIRISAWIATHIEKNYMINI